MLEREKLMCMKGAGCSLRAIASKLHPALSMTGRELVRNAGEEGTDNARVAGVLASRLCFKPRGIYKLTPLRRCLALWRTTYGKTSLPSRLRANLNRYGPRPVTYPCPRIHQQRPFCVATWGARPACRLPAARPEQAYALARRGPVRQVTDMTSMYAPPVEIEYRMALGPWEWGLIKGRGLPTIRRWAPWSHVTTAWCCWRAWCTGQPSPTWKATLRCRIGCMSLCARR